MSSDSRHLVNNLRSRYEELYTVFQNTYNDYLELLRIMNAEQLDIDLVDLVDAGFLCKRMEDLLTDFKREATAKKTLTGKVICRNRMKQTENEEAPNLNFRGRLATAIPEVKLVPKLPQKRVKPGSKEMTQEYKDVLRKLGVSDSAIESDCFNIQWPRFVEHCTRLVEEGKESPFPVHTMNPVYHCTFRERKQKDLDE